MADPKLVSYVKENLARGVKIEAIKAALKKAGYTDNEIEPNLAAGQKADNFSSRLKTLFAANTTKSQLAGKKPTISSRPLMQPQIMRPTGAQWQNQKLNFWQKTKQWLRQFYEKHKKHIPWAVLGALFITFIILLLMIRTRPPAIEFYDNSTGKQVEGSVYYNSNFLGETKGIFNKLPKDFCKQEGMIEIVTRQGRVSWPTEPSDCRQRKLQLIAALLPVKEVNFFVKLEFQKEETGEGIGGTLFIDGKNNGLIKGAYEIYAGDCPGISIINLTNIDPTVYPKSYREWAHDPTMCTNDVIIYKIPIFSPETKPEEPRQQPTPQINTTKILMIQQELDRVTKICEANCPQATCNDAQKTAYCIKYIENTDLNANGQTNNYVPMIFGDYGVCEDRVYCSQILNCNCDGTLEFETCIPILCAEHQRQGKTKLEQTEGVKKLLSEGACQNDSGYDARTSWWTNMQDKLNCT
jgi:hypothetical protein